MGLKYTEELGNNPIYEMISSKLEEVEIIEIKVGEESIGKRIPSHWHRSVEIIVPLVNETNVCIENVDHIVEPGKYYVVNSRAIHTVYSPTTVNHYYGYAIQIKYDFLKKIYPNIDGVEFDTTKNNPELYAILQEIIQTYKEDEAFKVWKLQGLTYLLTQILFKSSANVRQEDGKNQKHRELMRKITNFIDHNYAQDINVDTIAQEFHLSYGYLATIFKQYMGYGVKEYINYIRVKKSENDLKDLNNSITEVYLKNGFTNSKSYYREFKKYHSSSPKEFRTREAKK